MTAKFSLLLLLQLALYDLLRRCSGPRMGLERVGRVRGRGDSAASRERIVAALPYALALYPKRVKCLQRSFALARVLRAHGVPAEVVIGYRPEPFMSHAWVEAGGEIAEGPSSYRQRLLILERIGNEI